MSALSPPPARPAPIDPAALRLVLFGMPDAGKSDHALYLAKMTTTATNAAGMAVIDGVAGLTLTEIGWDVRSDGHCGAGAPRFNVVTSDNVVHFIGCNSPAPISTTLVTDSRNVVWKRLRTIRHASPHPPGVHTSISIIFDEGTDRGG
jgi:hypothetical protein